jgi:hypothetical protein
MTELSQTKGRANINGKWILLHSVLSTAVANIVNVDKVAYILDIPHEVEEVAFCGDHALAFFRLSVSVRLSLRFLLSVLEMSVGFS